MRGEIAFVYRPMGDRSDQTNGVKGVSCVSDEVIPPNDTSSASFPAKSFPRKNIEDQARSRRASEEERITKRGRVGNRAVS